MGMFDKYTEDFAGNNRVKEIEEESRFIDEPIYRGASVTHTFVVPAKQEADESGIISYVAWPYCHIYYVQSTNRILDIDASDVGVIEDTKYVKYEIPLTPLETTKFRAGMPNNWVSIQVVVKPSIASDNEVQVSNIFLAKVVDSLNVIPDEEYVNEVNE